MKKDYGKLSADQVRRLVGKFPEMKESIRELPSLLHTSTSEKLKAVLKDGVFWAPMYELSFAHHLALGLYVIGQKVNGYVRFGSRGDLCRRGARPPEAGLGFGPTPAAWEAEYVCSIPTRLTLRILRSTNRRYNASDLSGGHSTR